jgi:hypothetical protein
MGCCSQHCLAVVALLGVAALAPATTIDSSASVSMLEARSTRQWARLAACADQGPCQVGYSYFIDLPDNEREQRTKVRFEFFGAGFSFPLISLGPSRERSSRVSIPESRIDFDRTLPSFDSIPSVFQNAPSQPSSQPSAASGSSGGSGGGLEGIGQPAASPPTEQAVPEPVSILMGAAGLGLLLFRRRKQAPRV